jgi:citrate synthase
MPTPQSLTAQEASDLLGITPATLYAYVSRGQIRSEAVEGDPRARRYSAEDVFRLRERKEQRRNPAEVARAALHWGAPVLESALTLISAPGLSYRGQDALDLATTRTFEEVAALLWAGNTERAGDLFGGPAPPPGDFGSLAGVEALDMLDRWMIDLTLAGPRDLAAYTLRSEANLAVGARILRRMAVTLVPGELAGADIAERLAAGWAAGPAAAGLINAALILSADHELNASSFVARVVASADAPLYSVVIAGLSTLHGFRHGANILRVEALLGEIATSDAVIPALAGRLRRGERIPGFGHKLYGGDDPRARHLLALLGQAYPDVVAYTLAEQISQAAQAMIGRRPNIDFALAVLARTLALPPGAALWLFALGRAAGWIAHALEQYNGGELIRPRAAYVGPPVSPG